MLNFLKKKEIKKIHDLQNQISVLNEKINDINNINILLTSECDKYKIEIEKYISEILHIQEEYNILNSKLKEISKEDKKQKINKEIEDLNDLIKKSDIEYKELIAKNEYLSKEIENKKNTIIELDNTILLQEFGLYTPVFDFASSEEYKYKLEEIRSREKYMILRKTAATCPTAWTVNGSIVQGRIMTEQNIKQILRCFNDECEVLIDKVKFNNIEAYTNKMIKSYEVLNKMNSKNEVSISWEYLQLKLEELKLSHEYALKKQSEKEEQRRYREQLREEAKLLKEIEEARKQYLKEKQHYENALYNVNILLNRASNEDDKKALLSRKNDIENRIGDINISLKDIDYREANKKAGYVYIISNIGSFGENVYKIGMTRRLDPMERVNELGDASVPFKFDVHAMIFSDDAPQLEAALHKAFDSRKVNMINSRREFFRVTLDEIEEVVKENFDKTVEFNKIPIAEQYRETKKLLLNTQAD